MILNKKTKMNLKLKNFIIFVLAILLAIFLQGTSICKTISVCDQDCDFSSIAEGINLGHLGDTIEVQSGIYYENLNVSKPIALIGKDTGEGKPVIDAGGKGNAITVFAEEVTVDGFNLTNSLGSRIEVLAGIEVLSNHSTIINNLAFNNENGILVTSSDNIIRGNEALSNIYGIKIKGGAANNSIIDNSLMDNNYGLFLLASKDNTILGNQAEKNEFGIMLNESSGNNLSRNEMQGNKYNFGSAGKNSIDTTNIADGKPILYLVGTDNTIIDSSVDASEVYCIDCYNITIKGLDLKSSLYGIYLDNVSHSFLENNTLSNNSNGIALINSHRNSITNNQAIDNIEAVTLAYSKYNNIRGNNALRSQYGIRLDHSDYNRILYNQGSNSESGLSLSRSGFNLLSENNLTSNSIGVHLSLSWLNKIFDNNVTDNDQGILLDSSASNNLSGNRIINSNMGVLYDPLDNNTINSNNQYFNNSVNFEEIRSRSTAAGGIKPSISVRVDSNPRGAAIIKDGDLYGETPGDVFFTEPGEYTILIKKEGYKDQDLNVEIPSQVTSKTFTENMRKLSIDLIPEEESGNDEDDEK